MFFLKSEIEFDMAHFLYDYDGKCSNIHGHRYRLVATFKSETLGTEGQTRGMVADFHDIKDALASIAGSFDHKLAVEDNDEGRGIKGFLKAHDVVLLPFRPTAEEMSRDFFYRLKEAGLPVYSTELFETPTNSCLYME